LLIMVVLQAEITTYWRPSPGSSINNPPRPGMAQVVNFGIIIFIVSFL